MVDKSKIRGELVRLKTDLEEVSTPERIIIQRGLIQANETYEPLYRGTIEKTLDLMEKCDLKGALSELIVLESARGYLSHFDYSRRLPGIYELLIDTLVEIANNNCKCQFKEEE